MKLVDWYKALIYIGSFEELPVKIRLIDILPRRRERKYFAYKGSLTTPPCTENVQWIVMKCPVVVSRKVSTSIVLMSVLEFSYGFFFC